MTSKQLERKVYQLYTRKKLVETVGNLEDAIKTFMLIDRKDGDPHRQIHR